MDRAYVKSMVDFWKTLRPCVNFFVSRAYVMSILVLNFSSLKVLKLAILGELKDEKFTTRFGRSPTAPMHQILWF